MCSKVVIYIKNTPNATYIKLKIFNVFVVLRVKCFVKVKLYRIKISKYDYQITFKLFLNNIKSKHFISYFDICVFKNLPI